MKGPMRILRRMMTTMRDDGSTSESADSLRRNYTVSIRRSRRIPGTFTKERPSNISFDIFWVVLAVLLSFIFAGASLSNRRRTIWLNLHGNAADLDFRMLHPDLVVRYLTNHKDIVQKAIDSENGHISFLARFMDPFPKFISNPHAVLVALASIPQLYFVYRFCVQHRNWRYNNRLVLFAFAMFLVLYLSPVDTRMSMFVVLNWILPTCAAISILLHNGLRDNIWRPLTVVLELNPKRDGHAHEDDDDDTQALLNYDELTNKGDR